MAFSWFWHGLCSRGACSFRLTHDDIFNEEASMKFGKKVLLVSDNEDKAVQLEGILKIAGHDVVFRQDLHEADNLCVLMTSTTSRFNLLIADVATHYRNRLIEMCEQGLFDRLLLVQEMPDCTELYSIKGRIGCLCQTSVLLAAIRELFSSTEVRDKEEISCGQDLDDKSCRHPVSFR